MPGRLNGAHEPDAEGDSAAEGRRYARARFWRLVGSSSGLKGEFENGASMRLGYSWLVLLFAFPLTSLADQWTVPEARD